MSCYSCFNADKCDQGAYMHDACIAHANECRGMLRSELCNEPQDCAESDSCIQDCAECCHSGVALDVSHVCGTIMYITDDLPF